MTSPPEATGWRPIDATTPGNLWLLVWDGKNMAVAANARPQPNNPVALALADGKERYWRVYGSAFAIKPTHYMRLPLPPPLGEEE